MQRENGLSKAHSFDSLHGRSKSEPSLLDGIQPPPSPSPAHTELAQSVSAPDLHSTPPLAPSTASIGEQQPAVGSNPTIAAPPATPPPPAGAPAPSSPATAPVAAVPTQTPTSPVASPVNVTPAAPTPSPSSATLPSPERAPSHPLSASEVIHPTTPSSPQPARLWDSMILPPPAAVCSLFFPFVFSWRAHRALQQTPVPSVPVKIQSVRVRYSTRKGEVEKAFAYYQGNFH
jgi:hypothetical protein